jgi:lipoate-protein ligase A
MPRRAGEQAEDGSYWFWSDSTRRPGWLNMAIDTALLEQADAGERWLRLYAWEPCLSFGRHEPAERRYDAEAILARGLMAVRRPTGGRAVWHETELTYAVAVPSRQAGGLREAYREIHEMLCDALRALGAAAELAPSRRPAPVDAGACFASAAGGEVLVRGRKVIGSAQVRQGAALLQHGSLLLQGDQSVVAAVSRGTPASDRALALSPALGRPVGWQEAAEAIGATASRRWGVRPAPADRVADILNRAGTHAERYRSESWTWSARSPADVASLPC